jgi:hypothetical protein
MKTVTIEIPDDSELIKEGNIYKICRVIPKTWEEFCNRTPIRQEYFIGYDSKINLRENKGRTPYGDRNLHASEAERYINSVWHDMKEKPDFKKLPVLLKHKSGVIHFIDSTPTSWKYLIKHYVKWVYIRDLLPNEEK